jgi:hypothetical protein
MAQLISKTVESLCLAGLIGLTHSDCFAAYQWNASSGLLPDQVPTPMTLTNTSLPKTPLLSGGTLTLENDYGPAVMGYFHEGVDFPIPPSLQIDASVRYVSGTTTEGSQSPIELFFVFSSDVFGVIYVGSNVVFSSGYDSGNFVRRASAVVDTTEQFLDLRIVVSGTAVGSGFDVFQGATLLFSDTLGTFPVSIAPKIGFGDGSGESGVSEWKSYSYTAVPEPSVTVSVVAGALGILTYRRWKGFANNSRR